MNSTWQSPWWQTPVRIVHLLQASAIEVNGIRGYLIPGDVDFIWELARSLPRGGRYLEVGSWLGLSAALAATSILTAGNASAQLFCVDAWEEGDYQPPETMPRAGLFEVFRRNIDKAGLSSMVVPIRGRSTAVAPLFADGVFDIVFIDADHSYQGCLEDINTWLPKMRPGGRMLGHDAVEEGPVHCAVRDFCKLHDWRCTIALPPRAHFIWEIFPPPLTAS